MNKTKGNEQHRNRIKIAQSVRIKRTKIHRSGNEKFLDQLEYGRFFRLKSVARSILFAR